jgi:DNA helicase-2/ATP-dependent DNA helicase PcrA
VREIRQRIDAANPERVLPSSVAVLFRTNEQPRPFELELRRARVPYVLIGGQSFYDRKEIRDIVAYLRVLANPNDEVSLLRIINTPARGIGTSSIETLLGHAVGSGQPLWQALPPALAAGILPDHVADRVRGFIALLNRYRAALAEAPLATTLERLITEIDYKSELERVYKEGGEAEARWETLEELVNAAAQYERRAEQASLLGFLEETTLAGREDNRDDADQRKAHTVTLMTLHSAKGLEFPHVYLVGLEEGLLPHKRSVAEGRGVDEERRLCYVGVTRAQDSLCLSFARNRTKWGKLRPSIPSRFLFEMRGQGERAARLAEASAEAFSAGAARSDAPPEAPRGTPQPKTASKPRPSKARRSRPAGGAR